MNQDYKFRIDRMRQNDPVWPDGRKMFLNYAYLVSCEYVPAKKSIVLAFTTHQVTLNGIRLDTLFDELMEQLPKVIACKDERYNSLQSEAQAVVNEIQIVEK